MLRKIALWILWIKEWDIHTDQKQVIIRRWKYHYVFLVDSYTADTMRWCEWRLIIDKSNK